MLLAAFLRSRADEQTISVAQRRGLAALQPLERELKELQDQRETIKASDLPALEAAISRSRDELQRQRSDLDVRLAKLRSTQ